VQTPPRPVERLQGPVVDVPVPANTPAASTAVPVLVVPGPGAGSAGGTAGSGGATGVPGGAAGGVPGGLPGGIPGGIGAGAGAGGAAPRAGATTPLILPNVSNLPGPYRIQPRRSLADMANEQLRRGQPRDPLADSMQGAGLEDCARAPSTTSTVGGLLNAPVLAARALSGRCPK